MDKISQYIFDVNFYQTINFDESIFKYICDTLDNKITNKTKLKYKTNKKSKKY